MTRIATMPFDLPDWSRQYFTGQGGRPCLFYVVYGAFVEISSLSASKYRSGGIPADFNLSRYDRQQHPDVLHQFQSGYLWDEFLDRNSSLADSVRQSSTCLILRGEIEDSPT